MFDFVFFCKQKTAYEMRISDWSSDVCSSDLGFVADVGLRDRDAVAATERLARGVEAVLVDVHQHHAGALAEEPLRDRLADAAGTAGDDGDLVLQAFHGHASEIGRAHV